MHELSIALSIVEAASTEAARHTGRVSAVHVKVGKLTGIVSEALVSSYDMAILGTPLAGSTLAIEEGPAVVFCPHCREQRELESVQLFRCSVCGTLTPDVRAGDELQLLALEIEQ